MNLQALNELLIVRASSTFPISDTLHCMSHLQEVLDVSR